MRGTERGEEEEGDELETFFHRVYEFLTSAVTSGTSSVTPISSVTSFTSTSIT